MCASQLRCRWSFRNCFTSSHRDANITQPEFIFGSASERSERSGEPRNCPAPHCQIFKTTKHDQASSSLTVHRLPLQEPERMLKNTCKKMKHAIICNHRNERIRWTNLTTYITCPQCSIPPGQPTRPWCSQESGPSPATVVVSNQEIEHSATRPVLILRICLKAHCLRVDATG